MIDICGRKVKVQTGTKSQTVNVCTSENKDGHYAYTVRLSPPFVSIETLLNQNFNSILDLVRYLERQYAGKIERMPANQSSSRIEMQSKPPNLHPLIELFRSPEVNTFERLARAASALSKNDLLVKFEQQGKAAPYRGLHLPYFVEHTGKTTSGLSTNRREEHLAIALWRRYRQSGFALPDGTTVFPLDYQLPLKSHRDEANAGIGKIDLLCVESKGEPWIGEVKIHSFTNGGVETPLKALLEALAYCAILDPDMRHISRESDDKKRILGRVINPTRPNLLILATAEYWDRCGDQELLCPWRDSLRALSRRIEVAFKLRVRFVRMNKCRWEMTDSGMPCLIESPAFDWATPNA